MLRTHRIAEPDIRLQASPPARERPGAKGPAGWLGLPFRRAIHAPAPEQERDAGLTLCLKLRLERGEALWLEPRGTSMLPWRFPGCQVWLEPAGPKLEPGAIAVFRHGPKLYYHRVLGQTGPDQWQTKGDTLLTPDPPVNREDLIGCVTAVRRGEHVRAIEPDPGAAGLSRILGKRFSRFQARTSGVPRGLIRFIYLCVLLPLWPWRRVFAARQLEQPMQGASTQERAHHG